ncbi:hypothetical protein LQW54_003804 [Pestalotiopsis sp. IQ-011]
MLVKDVEGAMSSSRCLALIVEQMKALQIDKSEDCRLPMTPEASGGSAEEEESGKEHNIPNHYGLLSDLARSGTCNLHAVSNSSDAIRKENQVVGPPSAPIKTPKDATWILTGLFGLLRVSALAHLQF